MVGRWSESLITPRAARPNTSKHVLSSALTLRLGSVAWQRTAGHQTSCPEACTTAKQLEQSHLEARKCEHVPAGTREAGFGLLTLGYLVQRQHDPQRPIAISRVSAAKY